MAVLRDGALALSFVTPVLGKVPRVFVGEGVLLRALAADQAAVPFASAPITVTVVSPVGVTAVTTVATGNDGVIAVEVVPVTPGSHTVVARCTDPPMVAQFIFIAVATALDTAPGAPVDPATLDAAKVAAQAAALSASQADTASISAEAARLAAVQAKEDAEAASETASQAGAAAGAAAGASAGAAAGAGAGAEAAAVEAMVAIGAAFRPVPIAAATSLDAQTHGARLLVLTGAGNQISAGWDDVGDGFACTLLNRTSYWAKPELQGFTQAFFSGVSYGIRPGGIANFLCVEDGDERLAYLVGNVE